MKKLARNIMKTQKWFLCENLVNPPHSLVENKEEDEKDGGAHYSKEREANQSHRRR